MKISAETLLAIKLAKEDICMDILAILARYNLDARAIRFFYDPRGFTVKINFSDGQTNSFAGEGWGI